MTRTALDLFAGAGGATQGLRDAGFDVIGAVENDPDAAATWSLNHPGRMFERDVRLVSGADLREVVGPGNRLDLLKACPPCQGFSSLRGGRIADPLRNDLVIDTLRVVEELMPRAVLLENVPGLRRDERFSRLLEGMQELGYGFAHYIAEASELGVPQRRRRLVVVALHKADIVPSSLTELMPPEQRRPRMTAGQKLADLANHLAPNDPVHIWRKSSQKVAQRVAAVPVDGNRFDLPEELQLACHRRLVGQDGGVVRSATGSYGRVKAGEPAPTMTTRCTTPACGAFIHPTENRGLSLREAAAIQTFPDAYKWSGNYGSIERQIGNAVPVWMAQALGQAVHRLLDAQARSHSDHYTATSPAR